jgi:V8-like Glu-specific endopeptidase
MSDTGNVGERRSTASIAAHYRRLLKGKAALQGEGTEGLDTGAPPEADLSDAGIGERIEGTRQELHRIVKDYLGDEPELHDVADKIVASGKDALLAVSQGDDKKLAKPGTLSALEVIVRTDGSRPSFMVRNGEPDRKTSPLGEWGDELDDRADNLRRALQCIGRIDDPSGAQGFQGTGILIGKDLVMTNRHVLQAISTNPKPSNGWQLKPEVAIDFGHEFRGTESAGRRKIKGVVFAGSQYIDPFQIDLGKLDLALLELEPARQDTDNKLALDVAPDWGQPETSIFICGYPGNPGSSSNPSSLLELLFQATYGCKRLAPGIVTTVANAMGKSPRHWALGHDATTLGGNSGSAVLVIGREQVTAGLHFGGRSSDPRENWCHVLGMTLDETDGRSTKTLGDVFKDWGVTLVDRFQSLVA